MPDKVDSGLYSLISLYVVFYIFYQTLEYSASISVIPLHILSKLMHTDILLYLALVN